MKLILTEKQILELISFGRGVSRKKIAEMLRVTQATTTKITKQFLEQGLIMEGERIGTGMGRKEVQLYAHPDKFRYLGIDIGGHFVRFALSDNKLEILHESQFLMSELVPIENRAELFMQIMMDFFETHKIKVESIDAIGIGVTGIVSGDNKSILSIPNIPQWDEINLVDAISERIGCPVYLNEGGRTMALAEQMLGMAETLSNFIVVHVGRLGVVSGIMINGQLLRGDNNTAGLLGHTTADPNGIRCFCGNYGCLENIITFPMLNYEFNNRSGIGSIAVAYQKNDKIAMDVCLAGGKAFGIALSNVVNLFNPNTIFIGGLMFEEMPLLLDETKRTLLLRANRFSTLNLKLQNTSFGSKQGLYGALALAKQSFIEAL
ncbi:ROK family transcriptional regulator [Paenibacillus eucommiae]|uniref:N-acetylglucosamine repressor n=1 Tax=Paenibacillus eucommiae TaxID=1355755 RepID=A0ABS4IRD9_9BACL|nr:ROK family transcriptional regulator [Paenibacillus eucommiae]MBP1990138.1 N-acetylglucosamine repressor [Paenibacillus eucommiae]